MKTRILSILMIALLVAACAPRALERSDTPVASAQDQSSLIEALRAAGAEVEPGDTVEQPFLAVSGSILTVDGEDVQVFEYASAEAMEADAAQISPEGDSAAMNVITWIATPHFFRSGHVLVLYVGDDAGVLETLEKVLGGQFAGG